MRSAWRTFDHRPPLREPDRAVIAKKDPARRDLAARSGMNRVGGYGAAARRDSQSEPGQGRAQDGGNIIFDADLYLPRAVVRDAQFNSGVNVQGQRIEPSAAHDDFPGLGQARQIDEPDQQRQAVPEKQSVQGALVPPRWSDPHQAQQQGKEETPLERDGPSVAARRRGDDGGW